MTSQELAAMHQLNQLTRLMQRNTSTDTPMIPFNFYKTPEQRCAQIIEAVNRRRVEEEAFMIAHGLHFTAPRSIWSSDTADEASCSSNYIEIPQENSDGTPYFSRKIDNNQSRNQKTSITSPYTSADTVNIGPNGTKVNAIQFENINWKCPLAATRKLITLVFSKKTLATHTLSGRPSPAFVGRERPMKYQLNRKKVEDIICTIVNKTKITRKEVRSVITMKCANTKICNNKRRKHIR